MKSLSSGLTILSVFVFAGSMAAWACGPTTQEYCTSNESCSQVNNTCTVAGNVNSGDGGCANSDSTRCVSDPGPYTINCTGSIYSCVNNVCTLSTGKYTGGTYNAFPPPCGG